MIKSELELEKNSNILKNIIIIEIARPSIPSIKFIAFIMQIMQTLSKIMRAQVVFLQIVFQKLKMLLALRQLTNNYPMNKSKTHSNEWVFLVSKYYS